MRYRYNEYAPSGKRQYLLAMGVKDIEIIMGLIQNACAHAPTLDKINNPEYADVYTRLRSMRRALSQAHTEAEKLSDEGKRRKPLTPRGDPNDSATSYSKS